MVENGRVVYLNNKLVNYIQRLTRDDIERALREWDGRPPTSMELLGHLLGKAQEELGEKVVLQHSTKEVTQRIVNTHLKKLVKYGIVSKESYWKHRLGEPMPAGRIPKNVYLHRDRVDGMGKWIPHSEWVKRKA